MFNYQAPPNCLDNKIILITGASEGIGRAMAKSYASFGATVLLHGRDVTRLEALYDEIVEAGGKEPAICPLDLKSQNYEDYYTLQQSIGHEFGRLDGLVHNAGMLGRLNPISSMLTNDWLDVMQVNANAPFFLSKALLPLLEESDSASVIFTSSSVGRKARANWGAYAASKFAVEALMQIMADELENISNIRCNSVNPGATNTAMRKMAYPGEQADSNPSADEILPIFLYLMSDDSRAVNGLALNARSGSPEKLID
jgi:NAD(P)-dependent dehydrogenase (short-subunit alcohol dehydrogenase family)